MIKPSSIIRFHSLCRCTELWLSAPTKKGGKFSASTKTVEANDDYFMIKPSSIMQHKTKMRKKSENALLVGGTSNLTVEESANHMMVASRDVEDVIQHVNNTEEALPDYTVLLNIEDEEHNV